MEENKKIKVARMHNNIDTGKAIRDIKFCVTQYVVAKYHETMLLNEFQLQTA